MTARATTRSATCSTAAPRDRRLRVVNLSRNFGKEAALTAGIDDASGDVLSDGHRPAGSAGADRPFIDALGRGLRHRLRRARRAHLRHRRQAASRPAGSTGSSTRCRRCDIPENVGDFRLIDRRGRRGAEPAARAQPLHEGPVRLGRLHADRRALRAAAARGGLEQFNLWRLWNFALDGVMSFSTVPLRVWFYVGVVIAAVAVL